MSENKHTPVETFDCDGCRPYCYGGYHMRLDGDGRGDYVKTEDFRKVEQQRDELLNHLEILVGGRPEFWDADGWFTYKEVSDAQEAICSVKANNAS